MAVRRELEGQAVSLSLWRSSAGLWYGMGSGPSPALGEVLSGLHGEGSPELVPALRSLLSDPDGLALSLQVMDS